MCTYLKNMEGYKLQDLKLKGFDSIQEMFDRAFKRVNTFEDFRKELVEGKEKRAGTELVQENTKKQKVEDDKETAELKQLVEIIPDEKEIAIDAIPLAVKSPSIVDWKIYKERRKSYYQIIRANGKSQMYRIFSQMLKSFNREDLEDLYKLVKAKYESTRPVEDLDLLLWGDLKTMFEPHVEDKVWRNQQDYKVLDWKLYDSCGVHSLRMQHIHIYMLVEKKYPLAPLKLSMMLEKKLIIDYENCSAEVNAASENMLEVTTASEYQVNAANAPVDDCSECSPRWCNKVLAANSGTYLENFMKDFRINSELLLIQLEPISIYVFKLLDGVPELIHVNFRDFSSDQKCRIARR
ncbi:hypothetical protein Tco_0815010 [Tanacetum coccineum]